MPGFPLAAIGAGLGKFAEDYRQQQYAQLQSQYVRMAMEKQRQENEAKELAGIALSSGGLPGFGNVRGGLGGGLGATPAASGGYPGSAPMPQQAPPLAAAPASSGPPDADRNPAAYNSEGVYEPERDRPTSSTQSLQQTGGYAEPGSPGTIALDMPSPAAAAPPPAGEPTAPAATAAPQTSAPAPDAGFEQVGETKDGKVIFNVPGVGNMDLTSVFRQVDPSAIAQRIKELRPNASPIAIAGATESLYKLANSGGKTEQLQVATLLKYLSATRGQDIRATTAADQQAVTTAGQDKRAAAAAAGQAATKDWRDQQGARSDQRIAQVAERLQQNQERINKALSAKEPLERRQALQAEQRGILAQLNPPGMAQQPSEQDRAILTQQLRQITNELRKISLLPPLVPQSTPRPGGGATAPLY